MNCETVFMASAGPPPGNLAPFAAWICGVDAAVAKAGYIHPHIARNGQHAARFADRVHGKRIIESVRGGPSFSSKSRASIPMKRMLMRLAPSHAGGRLRRQWRGQIGKTGSGNGVAMFIDRETGSAEPRRNGGRDARQIRQVQHWVKLLTVI
jgi:hypothetical protein